jgi:predicted transcriptional regulator
MTANDSSDDELPGESEASERSAQMCEMRAEGYSLQEIGSRFGLTRERVRQIIRDCGGPDSGQAAIARRARIVQESSELRQRSLALIAEQPGLTAGDVASALGTTQAAVRAALGDDARRLLITRHRGSAVFSDAVILAHLREAARQAGQPLTVRMYEEARGAFGGASAALVLQRFGTWRAACAQAGVEHGQPVRQNYHRRWTHGQLLHAVARYLSHDGSRGSFADYERWARGADGMPSGQTIRTQFGTWSNAKTEALTLLVQPGTGTAAGDGEG